MIPFSENSSSKELWYGEENEEAKLNELVMERLSLLPPPIPSNEKTIKMPLSVFH